MTEVCAIVAMDKNNAIGVANGLPWKLSDDFAFFREMTEGYPVIMGRHTWNSLPKKPLKNRLNIVLSTDIIGVQDHDKADIIVNNINIAMSTALDYNSEKIFVIGGSTVYKAMLPMINTLYITHVDAEVEADAYFPKVELPSEYDILKKVDASDKNTYGFEIRKYRKV